MLQRIASWMFGHRNNKLIKQYRRIVQRINAEEAELRTLPDSALQSKTDTFKARLQKKEALDSLLVEAFAVCREASRRVLGMRHFDVQLLGGIALHHGKVAEMRTGEGKTLVATLPAYLNALSGDGVHIVTVNDYLAQRDATWMRTLYEFLGLTVGINTSELEIEAKKQAYQADITYGTNNEFGFDYLRDHMAYSADEVIQRKLSFSIVDEVDSILIDEARTPLIISGPAEHDNDLCLVMDSVCRQLSQESTATRTSSEPEEEAEITDSTSTSLFKIDEKNQQVLLTEKGYERAESILIKHQLLPENASLYEAKYINLLHYLYAALKAHHLFALNQHYVVHDKKITIVDEFTGRLMPGRRWSEGIHQAVEAKEGLKIHPENKTLASITFQNYFRIYQKLAGMTGTARTEAKEFQQIYNLETVTIPTNIPTKRQDHQDQIFATQAAKIDKIVAEIKRCHEAGAPTLVGTATIESSEYLSIRLKKEKIPHQVLNAKHHQQEAAIIAQAGRPGVVTIATNMAGRGTDIVLGGNIDQKIEEIQRSTKLNLPQKQDKIQELKERWQAQHEKVKAAGGLHIIGTERHESRRIDNQLRGRAGRQGDSGSTCFYLSLEDSLMRIFAGDRIKSVMSHLKIPEDEAIEHALVSKALENAQSKVESRNFDIRKQLLEYDNVANQQRAAIYRQRQAWLSASSEALTESLSDIFDEYLENLCAPAFPPKSLPEQWDIPEMCATFKNLLHTEVPLSEWVTPERSPESLIKAIQTYFKQAYQEKREVEAKVFEDVERLVLLQSLDRCWREHLSALDHLRQGIHLRGFAQKNPKQEYAREAFALFQEMLAQIRVRISESLLGLNIVVDSFPAKPPKPTNVVYNRRSAANRLKGASAQKSTTTNAINDPLPPSLQDAKIGRNQLCPCNSGKKYKNCHGKLS